MNYEKYLKVIDCLCDFKNIVKYKYLIGYDDE